MNILAKNMEVIYYQKQLKYVLNLILNRVWVHTCTLDHENALNNYLKKRNENF